VHDCSRVVSVMTTLRFDAKEFVPATATKCCPSDATTNLPATSPSVLLSHSHQPHQEKNPKKKHLRYDGLYCNQNRRRSSLKVRDERRSAPVDTKHGKKDCKNKSGLNPRTKSQIQPGKLTKKEPKCTTRMDAADDPPRCCPSECAPDPMNCKMEFPELQPLTNARHGKGEQTFVQSFPPSNIWSSVISNDLVRMELKDQPSSLNDGSKNIDKSDRSITELVPLTQPAYVTRRELVSENERPLLASSPTEDVNSIVESCNTFQDELQYPAPKMRKALMPFEKLRDRWWSLLLLHEQEKQRLAEKEVDLVLEAQGSTAMNKEDSYKCDQKSKLESEDNESLCIAMCSEKLCKLSLSSKMDSCHDQYVSKLPLHDAIQRDDTEALKELISAGDCSLLNTRDDTEELSPLELAVKLNRPHLVRILSQAMDQNECFACEGYMKIAPLLMATDLGHHECVQAILSIVGSSSLLATKDGQGNTAVHYSCLGGRGCATFQCLLNFMTSSCSASLLFKLFSCRNDQEQTPLHIAAQNDRVDIVDLVLNHRNTSNVLFLSKLLTIQDIEHQTPLLAAISSGSFDVVMSFLMWRGNNCSLKRTTAHAGNGSTSLGTLIASSALCPLTWAVKCKDVDMVKLLLEFNDSSSGSGYKLNEALYSSVDGCSLEGEQVTGCSTFEIIRVLVEAGANPCVLDISGLHSLSNAVALAASQLKLTCLAQLVDSYEHYLVRVRHQRRHDPKLQSQPESFFASMENAENAERGAALREALLLSLSMACSSLSHDRFPSCFAHIQCCLLLYQKNAKLRLNDLQGLKERQFSHSARGKLSIRYPLSQSYNSSRKAENVQNHCSRNKMMMCLPWFDVRVFSRCAMLSLSSDISSLTSEQNSDVKADVELVCNDGGLYLAHEMVLRQSHKFAAAIRFARLRKEQSHVTVNGDSSTIDILSVNVDLSSILCRRLLEHLYHGSLSTGFSKGRFTFCNELLELMLVGDEYICLSLVHECLWRLLASADDCDRCLCVVCQTELAARHCSSVSSEQSLGPSHLVSAETVLDVLAAFQHISVVQDDNCVVNSSAGNLISALREMAFCIALCEFGSVVKSEAFEAQFNHSIEEYQQTSTAPGMFLYMLLQDLVDLWQESS
jgi:ankyrin repeat protein